MQRILTLLLLLLSSNLYGQISIQKLQEVEGVKDPVFVGDKLYISAEAKLTVKDAIKVTIDPTYKFSDILITRDGATLDNTGNEIILTDPGKYKISVVLFDPEKGIKRGEQEITIGGTPNPPPDPTPDQKIDNISVLMIYESSLLPTYKSRPVLHSTELRTFMSSSVSKDSTGFPNWRVLDKDTSFPVNCDSVFCKWLKTTNPPELPWIVIGNREKVVYQGPVPSDVEDVKKLITKYKK